MEIRGLNETGVKLFQLPVGSVFLYRDKVYMVTDEESFVDLETGCLDYFDEENRVTPVKGYFQITE